MRKFILFSAAMLFSHIWSYAQSISGVVKDAETQQPIAFATVTIKLLNSKIATTTDSLGYYKFDVEQMGSYELEVNLLGYVNQKQTVTYTSKPQTLNVFLTPVTELLSAVDVTALRANARTPVAYSNLNKEEIEARNEGRDVPFILKDLPSTVVNSDAGTGIGYTGLRIRGSDVSRINVTINGVPLNDPESQGVFWVNTPDIATNAQSIQVQRGVGTSTNGAGAFGASINLKTTGLNAVPSAQVSLSGGSFNTLKRNISVNSGLLNKHWNVEARLSKITSDGFIDRATANLESYYLSAAYVSKNTSVQFIHFGGGERTYQAWWGIPESKLEGDDAALETHIINNGYDSTQAYNLRNSGNRTYNYYQYENQVDDYGQKHYQLHLAHNFTKNIRANVALHYTKGAGFFEEFRRNDDLADYGLPNIISASGSDTIRSSDVIRRRWLDNDFYGTTYSLTLNEKSLELIYGGAFNQYRGDHFGELTWMENAGDVQKDQRYYEGSSLKTDFNNYLKAQYTINKLSFFADLQLRTVSYESNGRDNDQTLINIDTAFTFFNPKAGVSYAFNKRNMVYASVGVAQREPTRSDFIDAPQGDTPKPEYLTNLEVGYTYTSPSARFTSNIFYMNYKNQLVPNGELNDVGSVVRVNVPQSYRLGLELEGSIRLNRWLQLGANASFSENKILDYAYYLAAFDDNFNYLGYDTTRFESTDIAYSPSVVIGTYVAVNPIKALTLSLIQKSVGRQYLDNTSSADKSLDPFTVFDFRANYELNKVVGKQLSLNLLVANVFNAKYEPNGYTYGYRVGSTIITENFYYPMAGTNFLAGITLNF